MVDYAMATLVYDAQEALFGVFDNFPMRPLGGLMQTITFPAGRCYDRPSDELTAAVAAQVTHDTALRELLKDAFFVKKIEGESASGMLLRFAFVYVCVCVIAA